MSIRRALPRISMSGVLLLATTLGFALGLLLRLVDTRAGNAVWIATTALATILATIEFARGVISKRPGVDVIAVMALVGSLVLSEYLAGAIIAVMFSGGRALESFAQGRARRELRSLLERAPREVRREERGDIVTVAIGTVRPGDVIHVGVGELVPVDGIALDRAVLDESMLTGEPMPVTVDRDDRLSSGAINAGDSFRLRAAATAAESTYAGIIRMVETAQRERAPMVRLADRAALVFVPLTLVVAALAWFVGASPTRALAVLVVATPCPLILAVPVALVSGISRAAASGIVIKTGAALESMGRANILLLDKTGTITSGRPEVVDVLPAPGWEAGRVLGLAASVEQLSLHPIASAICRAAREHGARVQPSASVREEVGRGVAGWVGKHDVVVGRIGAPRELPDWARRLQRRSQVAGVAVVPVFVDGALAGVIQAADRPRPEAAQTLRALRRTGIREIVLISGDRNDVATVVGMSVGVDRVIAECKPADKVTAVREARERGIVLMAGDGVNDAPALAAADIGVALASTRVSAASEAADVVIVADSLDRLAFGVALARRARRVAWQSVQLGMGLSVIAMLFAGAGALAPAAGALLQEAIDVLAIGSALRVLGFQQRRPSTVLRILTRRFEDEHRGLSAGIEDLARLADSLEGSSAAVAAKRLRGVCRFLTDQLLPHEWAEGRQYYPAVDDQLGAAGATATMDTAHREIAMQVAALCATAEEIDESRWAVELIDVRRRLYSLHALLRLHFRQEEEDYFAVFGDDRASHGTSIPPAV